MIADAQTQLPGSGAGGPIGKLLTKVAGERRQARLIVVVLVGLLVAYLVIGPLVFLVRQTFFANGSFSLSTFSNAFHVVSFWQLVSNTLLFAAGATVLSVVFGTGLAYCAERTNIPGRRLLYAVALVPLVIPGVLYASAWEILASPGVGALSELLAPLGININVFSIEGMIWVQGLSSVPLSFLLMMAAFKSMDPTLEECAQVSGARLGSIVRRVTLRLAMPALIGTLLLTFIRNIEGFEVPTILGIPAKVWVIPSLIWNILDTFPPDYGAAGVYSVILMVIGGIGIWLYYRVVGRGNKYAVVSGRAYRSGGIDLGRAKWPAFAALLVYVLIALILPFLALLYTSLRPYWGRVEPGTFFQGLSLNNYSFLVNSGDPLRGLLNSLELSAGAATVVMLLMAVAAWIVMRSDAPGRMVLDGLSFVPLVMPGIVLGVSVLIFYLWLPAPVYGTLWVLLIAYATKGLPYGMRYASASIAQLGKELEESAFVSGATWLQTFRRVILPLLWPGLLAGWLYIVMSSMGELPASLLLYSPGSVVLPVVIWTQSSNGQYTQLAALGVVMILLLVVLVLAAAVLSRRFGVRVREQVGP